MLNVLPHFASVTLWSIDYGSTEAWMDQAWTTPRLKPRPARRIFRGVLAEIDGSIIRG